MFMYMFKIAACMLTLAVGFYLHVMVMIKGIKENLFAINSSAQNEAERMRIWGQLIEFIEFHTTAKQFSNIKNILIIDFIRRK